MLAAEPWRARYSARAGTPTAARTAAALVVVAAVVVAAAPPSATARVKLGSTFAVRPISGTVKVKRLGSKSYKRLAARATTKMGSSIDATRGTVKIVTARNAKGATQAGTFYDGAFVVTQARAARAVTGVRADQGRLQQVPGGQRLARVERCIRTAGPQAVGQGEGALPHQGPVQRRDGARHDLAHRGLLRHVTR